MNVKILKNMKTSCFNILIEYLICYSIIQFMGSCNKNDQGLASQTNTIDVTVSSLTIENTSMNYLVPSVGFVELKSGSNFDISAYSVSIDGISVPTGNLIWQSRSAIVSVNAGRITAKDTGMTSVTVTDGKGTSALIYVNVKKTGTTDETPHSVTFKQPTYLVSTDSTFSVSYEVFSRGGKKIDQKVSLCYTAASGEKCFNVNTIRLTAEGTYSFYPKFNGKTVSGGFNVVVFNRKTKGSTFLVDTVERVSNVTLREFPVFFTAVGVTSNIVNAEVIRSKLIRNTDGSYSLRARSTIVSPKIVISNPEIIGQTPDGKLTSLGSGRTLIQAEVEGVRSSNKIVTVSMDFPGAWKMQSSDEGLSGNLNIISYPKVAFHSTYERNQYALTDEYIQLPAVYPQNTITSVRNDIAANSICNASGLVAFNEYSSGQCEFNSCKDFTGKYKSGETIGGLMTCDGRYGRLTFLSDSSFEMKDQKGFKRKYVKDRNKSSFTFNNDTYESENLSGECMLRPGDTTHLAGFFGLSLKTNKRYNITLNNIKYILGTVNLDDRNDMNPLYYLKEYHPFILIVPYPPSTSPFDRGKFISINGKITYSKDGFIFEGQVIDVQDYIDKIGNNYPDYNRYSKYQVSGKIFCK
jgi:hypothetical protein